MNRSLADRVADAVLYEGYILYPYRPSVKNRQRWTFGGLYPGAYCTQSDTSEASCNQTECLVRGNAGTTIEVVVRFLHLTARQVGAFAPPLAAWTDGETPPFHPVEMLSIGDRVFHTWQEAEEREVAVDELPLGEIQDRPRRQAFRFPGRQWQEPITSSAGDVVGVLDRRQQEVTGEVELSAVALAQGLFRLSVSVRNLSPLETPAGREDALLRSLVSAHTLLGVRGGEFVSLLDPPPECGEAVAGCRNVGLWPVLVGEQGATDTVLASPIILYDYPQVAPESPGDLFDATEIDEILSLRILTLTDDEKRQAAAVDERVRAILARTEQLGARELLGLHGTMRDVGRTTAAETGGTTPDRRGLPLLLLEGTFAVCRLEVTAAIPAWATAGRWFSVTRTADELSIVVEQEAVPEAVACERDWRCLRVAGTIPFSAVGVLASLTGPLATAGLTLFAVSTFDTDYLLVKATDLPAVLEALRRHGHSVP